jgi:hypothetical protein
LSSDVLSFVETFFGLDSMKFKELDEVGWKIMKPLSLSGPKRESAGLTMEGRSSGNKHLSWVQE